MCDRVSALAFLGILSCSAGGGKDSSEDDSAAVVIPSMPDDGGSFRLDDIGFVGASSAWAASVQRSPGMATAPVVWNGESADECYSGPVRSDASPAWSWPTTGTSSVASGWLSTSSEAALFFQANLDDGSTAVQLATVSSAVDACALGTPEVVVRNDGFLFMPRFPLGDQTGDGDDDLLLMDGLSRVNVFNAPFAEVRSDPDAVITAQAGQLAEDGDEIVAVGWWDSALIADADGDGFGDVLLDIRRGHTDSSSGVVSNYEQIVLLPGPIEADVQLNEDMGVTIGPGGTEPQGAGAVTRSGDFDGDGYQDLLVAGTYGWLLMPGPISSTETFAESTAVLAYPSSYTQQVGNAGRFAGSDRDQVYIGEPEQEWNGSAYGAVYVCDGPFTGVVDVQGTCGVYAGQDSGDHAGEFVAPVYDTNGDGFDDLLVFFANTEAEPAAYSAHVLLGG